jgi:hypothetical protein
MPNSAIPDYPARSSERDEEEGVKIATPDLIVLEDDTMPGEVLAGLLFENISAQELINMSRFDLVNGQQVTYRPIKNLASLAVRYGPKTLIPLQNTSDKLFDNFALKFENYVPSMGSGILGSFVYLSPADSSLIIDVVNIKEDERVEVQIMNNGSILNDTIYYIQDEENEEE